MIGYVLRGIAVVAVFSLPVYITASLGSIPATVGLILLACILYVFFCETAPNAGGVSKSGGRTGE